jgi:hypothetical protein
VLVWQAATRDMNPTVPQSYIDRHLADDPARASAEYLAEFRRDIEGFVALEVVEAAVIPGRHELPRPEHTRYHAFCDPSGGSSDSMTLVITHMAGNRVIIDLIRERRAPFNPDACVKEFSDTLRSFGISTLVGDHYGGEWPRSQFKKHGASYKPADQTKSDLYLHLLPLLNSGRIRTARSSAPDQPIGRPRAPHLARRQGLNRPHARRSRRHRQRRRRRRGAGGPGGDPSQAEVR